LRYKIKNFLFFYIKLFEQSWLRFNLSIPIFVNNLLHVCFNLFNYIQERQIKRAAFFLDKYFKKADPLPVEMTSINLS